MEILFHFNCHEHETYRTRCITVIHCTSMDFLFKFWFQILSISRRAPCKHTSLQPQLRKLTQTRTTNPHSQHHPLSSTLICAKLIGSCIAIVAAATALTAAAIVLSARALALRARGMDRAIRCNLGRDLVVLPAIGYTAGTVS